MWDLADGAVINEFALPSDASYRKRIAVSADGNRIALARFMGDAVELWDLTTGQGIGQMSFEFPNTISHQTFTADLQRMACSQRAPVVLELSELESLNAR